MVKAGMGVSVGMSVGSGVPGCGTGVAEGGDWVGGALVAVAGRAVDVGSAVWVRVAVLVWLRVAVLVGVRVPVGTSAVKVGVVVRV